MRCSPGHKDVSRLTPNSSGAIRRKFTPRVYIDHWGFSRRGRVPLLRCAVLSFPLPRSPTLCLGPSSHLVQLVIDHDGSEPPCREGSGRAVPRRRQITRESHGLLSWRGNPSARQTSTDRAHPSATVIKWHVTDPSIFSRARPVVYLEFPPVTPHAGAFTAGGLQAGICMPPPPLHPHRSGSSGYEVVVCRARALMPWSIRWEALSAGRPGTMLSS